MYVVLLIYGLAVAVCCKPTASVSRKLAVSSSDASIDARGCCRYINCLAVLVLNRYNCISKINLNIDINEGIKNTAKSIPKIVCHFLSNCSEI